MTEQDNENQVEMFYKVRLDYTTLLNWFIDKGEMAKLGTDAVCILVVLRRFTQAYDKNDPFAKISKDKIAQYTGLSERTVARKIKILEENGYVEIINRGHKKRNLYKVTEKTLAMATVDNEQDKVLEHTYIPVLREQRKREMKYLEKHGHLPANSPIQIKPINFYFNNTVNVTINQNIDKQNITMVTMDTEFNEDIDVSKLPKWIADKVLPRINAKTSEQSEELRKDIQKVIDIESENNN